MAPHTPRSARPARGAAPAPASTRGTAQPQRDSRTWKSQPPSKPARRAEPGSRSTTRDSWGAKAGSRPAKPSSGPAGPGSRPAKPAAGSRSDWSGSDGSGLDRSAAPSRPDRPRPDRSAAGSRPDRSRLDRPRADRPRPERSRPDRRPVPTLTGPNAFVDLGVPATLAALLSVQGITEPTPIQSMTIPTVLAGRDVLGRGRTGSGKTLAFGLPMLARLGRPGTARRAPRGLVLTPTRELAMQVLDALKPLAEALGMRMQLVIGGSSYDRQIRGLERADIVVATPGRLVDLADRGAVDLGGVQVAVLDEADHMADLGFLPEIEAIMDRLPEAVQGLLFSATLDADVNRLVRRYLHDPAEHNADPASATVGTMAHHVVLVHPRDKDAVTTDIALRRGRTVAFVRTQLGADRLAGQLADEGVRTAALHGGMKQGQRTRTLSDFRDGRIDVLVATDVAARGIHVDAVDLVLHVDPPHGPKEYLHRSGRTARAGASGTVISLATLRQQRSVEALTARAGVTPAVLRARPGDEALLKLIS